MNTLIEIQKWFQKQCNGEWEHSQGIKIETCDNPAWWVKINIKDTTLENKPFKIISKNVPQELINQALGLVKAPFTCAEPSSKSWLICYVKNNEFNGVGDPTKLEDILRIFLNWINNSNQ
jgi:hypothetical protein